MMVNEKAQMQRLREMVFARKKGMRDLTLEEQANIQTFPFDYKWLGNFTAIETMIGNAVPPAFSFQIANFIMEKIFQDSDKK